MRVLFLEWKSFGNIYMIQELEKRGIEVCRFPFPQDQEDTRYSERLSKEIAKTLLEKSYDFVFSFNFFPVAAIACKACQVKYVSWVYDSPFIQLYSHTVGYETNYVFLFDQGEVNRLKAAGVTRVYHLPMAAAVEHYDKLCQSKGKQAKNFQTEIAFVGSMYQEQKHNLFRHLKGLDDYTKGYLQGLMEGQKGVYGYDFIQQALTPQVMKAVQKVCPIHEHGDGFETVEWVFAQYFLNRKITAMERQEVLELLSGKHQVTLYTHEKTPMLPKVENRGAVDYYDSAPMVFRHAKINLNITLRSIQTGIPLRAMDILGSGGFLLSNYQAELAQYFVPGEDFVYYENYQDLEEKVSYYLQHDAARQQIAENGRKKVQTFHTYAKRVDEILGTI